MVVDEVLTPGSFASVVASMSLRGETADTWALALKQHMGEPHMESAAFTVATTQADDERSREPAPSDLFNGA